MYNINPEIEHDDKQIIPVFRYGKHISYTTPYRAKKMVEKKSIAYWVDENKKAIIVVAGKSIRKRIKKQVVKKEGRSCYICGREIPPEEPFTLDHVVPVCDGGKDTKDNLKGCCILCNIAKKYRSLSAFIKILKADLNKENRHFPHINRERIEYLENQYINNLDSMDIEDTFRKE